MSTLNKKSHQMMNVCMENTSLISVSRGSFLHSHVIVKIHEIQAYLPLQIVRNRCFARRNKQFFLFTINFSIKLFNSYCWNIYM